MNETRAGGGLYRRLIERVSCALAGAEVACRRGGSEPKVLALQGLSPSEHALIRAYLRQDVQWLRGWHAAAEELELIESQERAGGFLFTQRGLRSSVLERRARLRHPRLFCALCGQAVRRQRASRLTACPACASRLFLVGHRCRPIC